MSDVTILLDAIPSGDPDAPAQLLPLAYDDLRRLATHRMAHESAGGKPSIPLLWSTRRICAWSAKVAVPRKRAMTEQLRKDESRYHDGVLANGVA
jgi:hypothetical protein